MKSILCLLGLIVIAAAYPAQEGAAYTNEAIRQAQTSHLIPQNAQIQNVSVINQVVGRHSIKHFLLLE